MLFGIDSSHLTHSAAHAAITSQMHVPPPVHKCLRIGGFLTVCNLAKACPFKEKLHIALRKDVLPSCLHDSHLPPNALITRDSYFRDRQHQLSLSRGGSQHASIMGFCVTSSSICFNKTENDLVLRTTSSTPAYLTSTTISLLKLLIVAVAFYQRNHSYPASAVFLRCSRYHALLEYEILNYNCRVQYVHRALNHNHHAFTIITLC